MLSSLHRLLHKPQRRAKVSSMPTPRQNCESGQCGTIDPGTGSGPVACKTVGTRVYVKRWPNHIISTKNLIRPNWKVVRDENAEDNEIDEDYYAIRVIQYEEGELKGELDIVLLDGCVRVRNKEDGKVTCYYETLGPFSTKKELVTLFKCFFDESTIVTDSEKFAKDSQANPLEEIILIEPEVTIGEDADLDAMVDAASDNNEVTSDGTAWSAESDGPTDNEVDSVEQAYAELQKWAKDNKEESMGTAREQLLRMMTGLQKLGAGGEAALRSSAATSSDRSIVRSTPTTTGTTPASTNPVASGSSASTGSSGTTTAGGYTTPASGRGRGHSNYQWQGASTSYRSGGVEVVAQLKIANGCSMTLGQLEQFIAEAKAKTLALTNADPESEIRITFLRDETSRDHDTIAMGATKRTLGSSSYSKGGGPHGAQSFQGNGGYGAWEGYHSD